jgi:hypothetical protein
MERRFSVEVKSFFFSMKKGSAVLRLEEKRKGYGGFILLGTKCSGWLADLVEEALWVAEGGASNGSWMSYEAYLCNSL